MDDGERNHSALMMGMWYHCYENQYGGLSLNKGKIALHIDPIVPLFCIDPKEFKSIYKNDTCTSMFIAALFTTAKLWNQCRCLTTNEG
jgi:hypothetical protein